MPMARFAVIGLGAALLAGVASTGSASADPYDYPWCAQGPSYGYPGECMYQTRRQCLASVSGIFLACGENPRFLFRDQPRPWPPSQPRRRHRHIDRH
jgi:Protein of unknown function (DUF3551)